MDLSIQFIYINVCTHKRDACVLQIYLQWFYMPDSKKTLNMHYKCSGNWYLRTSQVDVSITHKIAQSNCISPFWHEESLCPSSKYTWSELCFWQLLAAPDTKNWKECTETCHELSNTPFVIDLLALEWSIEKMYFEILENGHKMKGI